VLETTDARPHEFPFDTRGRRAAISQAADAGSDAPALPGVASHQLPLPRWPLLAGVFNFPWYPSVRCYWLALSAGATLVIGFAAIAIRLGQDPGHGYSSIGPWIVSVTFGATASVAALLWVTVALVYYVAIVRDTAHGIDRAVRWPEGIFLDWMAESLYVANSLALGVLPGLGIVYLAGLRGTAALLSIPASLLVLYPIVLLSMLERDSPLNPLSLPTWRSLLTAWWAWGLFYIESVFLSVAAGWLLWACVWMLGWMAIPLVAFVLVAAMMIYFRLLGRLALCCAAASRRKEAE